MHFLVAALLLFQGSGFPKPTIDRIAAVGDTVWFEGTRGFDAERRRYCYVRRTGAWCRLPQATDSASRPRGIPRSPDDSLAIAPGLTLVCRPYVDSRKDCETYGVVTANDRREHWLVPHITAALRNDLLRAIGLETEESPPVSTLVTSYVATGDGVWFGLGGGFPEGEGAFGGLLRFDRARRSVETITHPRLANATVTGLAVYGHELWIGTAHPGEFGLWGSTGILRRDLRTGRWTTTDSATAPLPDNLIQAVSVADSVVCVATRDGLAVFDPRARQWAVRYFRRAVIADSIIYALAVARPSDEAGDEALFVLMESLDVARRDAFVAAMRALGTERLRTLFTGERAPEELLAHRDLIPFLIDGLGSPRAASLAADALARIGDSIAVPAIRAALARAASVDAGTPLAAALARLGDSDGVSWLHERLTPTVPWSAQRSVVLALATLRAPASVSPLLGVLARRSSPPELQRAAIDALRAYESPDVWRRMTDVAGGAPELRALLVDAADSVAASDSIAAGALGEWALEMLAAGGARRRAHGAIRLAARLRPYEAVPALVRAVADSAWGGLAAHELVRLTGVVAAPAVDPLRGESRRRAAQTFWDEWWSANRTTYRVVPPSVGERAYTAWLTRVRRREGGQ